MVKLHDTLLSVSGRSQAFFISGTRAITPATQLAYTATAGLLVDTHRAMVASAMPKQQPSSLLKPGKPYLKDNPKMSHELARYTKGTQIVVVAPAAI